MKTMKHLSLYLIFLCWTVKHQNQPNMDCNRASAMVIFF